MHQTIETYDHRVAHGLVARHVRDPALHILGRDGAVVALAFNVFRVGDVTNTDAMISDESYIGQWQRVLVQTSVVTVLQFRAQVADGVAFALERGGRAHGCTSLFLHTPGA